MAFEPHYFFKITMFNPYLTLEPHFFKKITMFADILAVEYLSIGNDLSRELKNQELPSNWFIPGVNSINF